MKIISTPTDKEVAETIEILEKKLPLKKISKNVNHPIREGYIKSVEILKSRQTDLSGISELKTVQGRAIAGLAVGYLKGEFTQKELCEVPIK